MKDLRPLEHWALHAAKQRLVSKSGSKTFFDIIVNRNEIGFRRVKSKVNGLKKEHLFLVGCSYTLGEGVEDEEAFPSLLAEKFHSSEVVNMSVRGGGLAEHLYLWDAFDWRETYPQERGTFVLTMISDTPDRTLHTWRYLMWADENVPVYENADGQLSYVGLISEKWDYKFSRWLNNKGLQLYWLRLTSHFQQRIISSRLEKFVDQIELLKKMYLKRYPQGKFYVSWFAFDTPAMSREEFSAIKKELTKRKINYWDNQIESQAQFEASGGVLARRIPGDGHPNVKAHMEYAEFLLSRLNEGTR